jgi:hypothetical protein
MKSFLLASLVSLSLAFDVQAARNVVSAGDSLTNVYSYSMPAALAVYGDFAYRTPIYGNGGTDTSIGGLDAIGFVGAGPAGSSTGPIVDLRINCIAARPDVVLLMLGVNDCHYDNGGYWNEWKWANYQTCMKEVFDTFSTQPFRTVIGSITPINEELNDAYLGIANQHANERIDQYNAWLRQEADRYGFLYLDTNAEMKKVENWDATMLGVDGLHYSPLGANFMACQFAQAAELAIRQAPIIFTDVKVNAIKVGNVQVVANLTADSLIASSLTAGTYSVCTWAVNTDGKWFTPSNWSGGVPSGAGSMAYFTGNAPATVFVDRPVTVGLILFDSGDSGRDYTLAGSPITLSNAGHGALIEVDGGNHTIRAPVILENDTTITGDGTLELSGGLTGGFELTVLTNVFAGSVQVDSLVIGGGATVATAVPEPSALVVLLTAGAGGLLRRRRRT